MRKFLKPWMLVLAGVFMNIASALIVHTFIERNMTRMDALMLQSSTVDARIETLWENYRSLDRQHDFYTGLLLSSNAGEQLDAAHDLVRGVLNKLIEQHQLDVQAFTKARIQLPQMHTLFEQAQRKLLDHIDSIYLEKIDVEKQRQQLAEGNQRLNSIALFLQLLGLILVLSRDLARRD